VAAAAADYADHSQLVDAYSAAVANVNKAVDDADTSLHAVSEMPCRDLATLHSQLALLQVIFSYYLYR